MLRVKKLHHVLVMGGALLVGGGCAGAKPRVAPAPAAVEDAAPAPAAAAPTAAEDAEQAEPEPAAEGEGEGGGGVRGWMGGPDEDAD